MYISVVLYWEVCPLSECLYQEVSLYKDPFQANNRFLHFRNCSLYQKLFLRALLAEFQRSGVEEALFFQIIEHMPSLYALDGEKDILCRNL